ncbi:MAG: DUF2190 family protein [Gemmataceae bacterium]|nr:DUF2190 family protein [Gemmataceae bacterium]
MGCSLRHGDPLMVDYTPATAKLAEAVVVINGIPHVVHTDISASAKGSLAREGGVYLMDADGAIAAGSKVYWDATASKITLTAADNEHFGWLTDDSSAASDGDDVYVFHNPQPRMQITSYATASLATGTLSAGQITGAEHVYLETITDGAASMTTRTATQMFADIPTDFVGMTFLLTLINSGNNTLTLVAGVGVTLTGTMTVATVTTRTFVCTFTSATALTIQGVDKGSIEAT